MTTIDFGKALADAKSASFEAMPNGDYNIEVVKADAVTASTGRPMIKCKMKVIDGGYQNRPVMTQFVLSIDNPNALAMFFRNMKAFGLDENFFAQMGAGGQLDPVAVALVGRRAQVTLGTRKWQGEDRNEVTGIKPYTGAPGSVAGAPGAGMPGMLGVGGPGPIANIPGQVMQQAAQNFNPVTQLPSQQMPPQAPPTTPTPAAQLPSQPVAQPQAPVAPPVVPQAVQAPVAPQMAAANIQSTVTHAANVAQQAAEVAQQIAQADPGGTAATVSDLIAQQAAETAASTVPQPNHVPTAADTAPPAYAQQAPAIEPQQVTQYVNSDAQAMPAPPAPPI